MIRNSNEMNNVNINFRRKGIQSYDDENRNSFNVPYQRFLCNDKVKMENASTAENSEKLKTILQVHIKEAAK